MPRIGAFDLESVRKKVEEKLDEVAGAEWIDVPIGPVKIGVRREAAVEAARRAPGQLVGGAAQAVTGVPLSEGVGLKAGEYAEGARKAGKGLGLLAQSFVGGVTGRLDPVDILKGIAIGVRGGRDIQKAIAPAAEGDVTMVPALGRKSVRTPLGEIVLAEDAVAPVAAAATAAAMILPLPAPGKAARVAQAAERAEDVLAAMRAPVAAGVRYSATVGRRGEPVQLGFDVLKSTGETILSAGEKVPTQNSRRWTPEAWDTFLAANDKADAIAASREDGGLDPAVWGKLLSNRMPGLKGVPMAPPPMTLLRWMRNPGQMTAFIEAADPEVVRATLSGLSVVAQNHQLAKAGKLPKHVAATGSVWAVLSKGIGPADQEGAFIRLLRDPEFVGHLDDSIEGKFSVSEDAWKAMTKRIFGGQREAMWKSVSERTGIPVQVRDGKPVGKFAKAVRSLGESTGFGAELNVGAVYKMLRGLNGKWDGVAQILNDASLTGPQMTSKLFQFMGRELPRKANATEAIGFSDKVARFAVAALARDDVVVIDRVQTNLFWGDNVVAARRMNLPKDKRPIDITHFFEARSGALRGSEAFYEAFASGSEPTARAKKLFGTEVVTPAPAEADVRTHALYRAVESGLGALIESEADGLSRVFGYKPSAFQLHWMLWSAMKREPVGHNSLGSLLDLANSGELAEDFKAAVMRIAPQVTSYRREGGKYVGRTFEVLPTGAPRNVEQPVRSAAEHAKLSRLAQRESQPVRELGLQPMTPEEFIPLRDSVPSDMLWRLGSETPEEMANWEIVSDATKTAGVALKPLPGGRKELVNLAVGQNSPVRGASHEMMIEAIRRGATELNCFDGTFLPELYSRYGFEEVARLPFNEEFSSYLASRGWDRAKHGTPDVVFMSYKGGPRHSIADRARKFLPPRRTENILASWPENGIESLLDTQRAVRRTFGGE